MVVIGTTAKCAEGTSEMNHCRKSSTLGRGGRVGLWENQVRAEREILGLNLGSSITLPTQKLCVPSKPLFSLITEVRPGTQRQLRLEECLTFCQDWNLNSLEVIEPGNLLWVTFFRSLKGSLGQSYKDGH